MVRILCLGDSHIPNRAKNLPEQIHDKIVNLTTKQEIFDYTLFTGDVIKYPQLLKFLNLKTKRDLLIVLGNMDYHYGDRESPIYQELNINFEGDDKITVGLTHGTQIRPRGDHIQLENLAIQNEYNILVSGHTHKEEIQLTNQGVLLINPGSVTGAWSFVASGIPSFVVIKIDEYTKEIKVELFQLDKKLNLVNEIHSYFIFGNNNIQKKL